MMKKVEVSSKFGADAWDDLAIVLKHLEDSILGNERLGRLLAK